MDFVERMSVRILNDGVRIQYHLALFGKKFDVVLHVADPRHLFIGQRLVSFFIVRLDAQHVPRALVGVQGFRIVVSPRPDRCKCQEAQNREYGPNTGKAQPRIAETLTPFGLLTSRPQEHCEDEKQQAAQQPIERKPAPALTEWRVAVKIGVNNPRPERKFRQVAGDVEWSPDEKVRE